VGAAFVLREAFRAIFKVVAPGGGSVVSAAIAFTGTMAIGAAARAYYIQGVSLADARKVFRRAKAKASSSDSSEREREEAPAASGENAGEPSSTSEGGRPDARAGADRGGASGE
jgi:hypothetical protein